MKLIKLIDRKTKQSVYINPENIDYISQVVYYNGSTNGTVAYEVYFGGGNMINIEYDEFIKLILFVEINIPN